MDENVAALHQVKHEDDNNNNDDDNEKEPSDGMHNYLTVCLSLSPSLFLHTLIHGHNSNVIETMKLCISLKKSRYR